MKKLNPLVLLGALLISFLFLHSTFEWLVLSDDVYFDFYIDRLSYDRIAQKLQKKHEQKWLSAGVFLVVYSVRILFLALAFSAAFFAWNKLVDFKDVFTACVLAESVFLVRVFIKIVWFSMLDTSYNYNDVINFHPLSVLGLMNTGELEPWQAYPLSVFSFFEIGYVVLIAVVLREHLGSTLSAALRVAATAYASIMLLWLLLATFLLVINS